MGGRPLDAAEARRGLYHALAGAGASHPRDRACTRHGAAAGASPSHPVPSRPIPSRPIPSHPIPSQVLEMHHNERISRVRLFHFLHSGQDRLHSAMLSTSIVLNLTILFFTEPSEGPQGYHDLIWSEPLAEHAVSRRVAAHVTAHVTAHVAALSPLRHPSRHRRAQPLRHRPPDRPPHRRKAHLPIISPRSPHDLPTTSPQLCRCAPSASFSSSPPPPRCSSTSSRRRPSR